MILFTDGTDKETPPNNFKFERHSDRTVKYIILKEVTSGSALKYI